MNWPRRLLICLTICLCSTLRAAEQQANLITQLEPLRPLIGKTWKGRFAGAAPDKQVFDVARWERALNGQAIRVLHSVNNGESGGETLITWNPGTERLEFYYFTTAGFLTHGTVAFERGKMVTQEEVVGNRNGVTSVEATIELLPDGRLHTKSRYLKNGQWVDGQEVTYEESANEQVLFK